MAECVKEHTSEDRNEEVTVIGPVLPPHLMKKKQEESLSAEENEDTEETAIIGPALPPHLLKKTSHCADSSSVVTSQTREVMGPELPPYILNKESENEPEDTRYIGPHLPPHLRQRLQEQSLTAEEEEEEEDVYGPLPAGSTSYSRSQIALEERALHLKMDQLEPKGDKPPVREEWMLELPEVRAGNLGLGPRQFRTKERPDFSDRSSWTDTPNKKVKKEVVVDLKKEAEMKEIRKRDEEQERIAKKHKKKNKESLLELHQKEMKKKKTEEVGAGERRPFSREIDLQVNRFDEAQKKAVLKKAQLLDDRFSSGQSKFL